MAYDIISTTSIPSYDAFSLTPFLCPCQCIVLHLSFLISHFRHRYPLSVSLIALSVSPQVISGVGPTCLNSTWRHSSFFKLTCDMEPENNNVTNNDVMRHGIFLEIDMRHGRYTYVTGGQCQVLPMKFS